MTKRLEDLAAERWEKDGLEFFLYEHHSHWCGYVRFPKRPLIERGYHGIAAYVPVHGGLTFAQAENGAMTYGFDCNHLDDERRPELRDRAWLRAECERMGRAISVAANFEPQYLLAATDEQKAAVLDGYHGALEAEGILFNLRNNFGAMIRVMFGNL